MLRWRGLTPVWWVAGGIWGAVVSTDGRAETFSFHSSLWWMAPLRLFRQLIMNEVILILTTQGNEMRQAMFVSCRTKYRPMRLQGSSAWDGVT